MKQRPLDLANDGGSSPAGFSSLRSAAIATLTIPYFSVTHIVMNNSQKPVVLGGIS
jgi:hypothetical protein